MNPYYQDDKVTLYLGDCRESTEWLSADALVTDPPYGLGDRMTGGPKWGKLWSADGLCRGADPWLVWDKIVRNFTSGHCELAWTSLDQPVRAFNFAHAQLASEGKLHPTQKPLALMHWSVGFIPTFNSGDSARAAVVADPFAGSGTTLLAARNLGHKAIGVEVEERYCEIAAKRLDQMCLDFGDAS